jgi:hypothetical protein
VYKFFGHSTVEVKFELQQFHLADKSEIIKNSQWLGEQAYSLTIWVPKMAHLRR